MIIKLTNLQGFNVLVNSDYIISTQPMVRGKGTNGEISFTQINVHSPHLHSKYDIDVIESSDKILDILVNGQ